MHMAGWVDWIRPMHLHLDRPLQMDLHIDLALVGVAEVHHKDHLSRLEGLHKDPVEEGLEELHMDRLAVRPGAAHHTHPQRDHWPVVQIGEELGPAVGHHIQQKDRWQEDPLGLE